jgi:hypothetical protein
VRLDNPQHSSAREIAALDGINLKVLKNGGINSGRNFKIKFFQKRVLQDHTHQILSTSIPQYERRSIETDGRTDLPSTRSFRSRRAKITKKN